LQVRVRIVAKRVSAVARAAAGLAAMLDELVALLVPPRCAACRAPGRRASDVLCGACRRALPWLTMACCERCALPLPCGRRCPASRAPFDAAWSAVAYDGAARDVMHALKFSAARPLADVMAAQIAANAPLALLPRGSERGEADRLRPWRAANGAAGAPAAPTGGVAIVPVPPHPARLRKRGYDPAGLLARALARRTGLPLAPVLRRGATPSRQLGASRDERLRAGRLEFTPRGPAPQTAILVDDVHTTGATLSACASALRGAGAGRIHALTWARALDERLG
jgi:predicted amidophosphoribosyltransferase